MDVRVGLWRRLSAEELMRLNCGVGEDSWESLGLARRSNQSILKEISPGISLEGMMLKLKLQYFGHLMWRVNSLEKDSDAGRDWGQEERGTTEDEMAGWHHWLDGREFEWTPGVGDAWEARRAAIHGVAKSWTRLSDWTELNWKQHSTAHMDWSRDLIFLKYYTLSQYCLLNNLSSINVKSLEHVSIYKHLEYIHYLL